MQDDMSVPAPTLEWVMTLDVAIGEPQTLGEAIDGRRANYPILGGHFVGPGLQGDVLPGGADFYCLRPDGVGDLDATYSLRTDRGELINVHNRGFLVLSEEGRRREDEGTWPLPEHLYRCTCSPRFQVARGALGWLTEAAFIGRVTYPGEDRVVIRIYRLD